MSLFDAHGTPWAHKATIAKGHLVRADSGFTCIKAGERRRINIDPKIRGIRKFFIRCRCKAGRNRHYLHGQLNEAGAFVGLYRV